MTLYLTEADVEALLGPEDALEAVEACFLRLARGRGREPAARRGCGSRTGSLAVMAAADLELGYAGLKTYAAFGYERRPLRRAALRDDARRSSPP